MRNVVLVSVINRAYCRSSAGLTSAHWLPRTPQSGCPWPGPAPWSCGSGTRRTPARGNSRWLPARKTSEEELRFFIKEQQLKQRKFLLVGNKIDRFQDNLSAEKFRDLNILFISATQAQNIENLRQHLKNLVIEGEIGNKTTIVTNARHYEALRLVDASLTDITNAMNINLSSDLLSTDIKRCLHYLGEITGEITNEDQLDYIFSKFCIGK